MIAQLNDLSEIWWQWMGSMFWQVSLLIIIVTALDMVIRKWAWPQVRYALWALVFIKLIISPAWQMPTSIVSWIQPQVENQITFKVEVSEEAEKSPSNLKTHDEVKAPVIIEQASWQSFALLTWFSGMVLFSLMLLIKMYKFRKMNPVDKKTNTPEWFSELMRKPAARLKLKKAPSVLFSADAKSPAVYGVFRPVLLLPEGYLDKLSNEQAEHVLMHELCHLKRGDLLIHWFCIVVQLVYWFNPLLIWTRRQMRHVCEICCDLSVANVLREKTASYRETLLHSARELFAENMQPSLGFFGIFEEPFRLVPRLKWLEKRSWEKRKRRITVTICTSLFMVFCVIPMAGISQTSDYHNDKSTDQQIANKIDLSPKMVIYEILIMEADMGKNIDLGTHRRELLDSELFRDGINLIYFDENISVDGQAFADLNELYRKMQVESGVTILTFGNIMIEKGNNALMMNSAMNINESVLIKPEIIKDNIIQQKLTIGNQFSDDKSNMKPTHGLVKNLILKIGKTCLVKIKAGTDISSRGDKVKDFYLFITPQIENPKDSQVLKSKLQQEINLEIASLKASIDETNTMIKHYQIMVEETPIREQELSAMNRDYEVLKEQYTSYRNKKIDAEIAVSMERKQAQKTTKKMNKEEEAKASETLAFLTDELEAIEKRLIEKEEERKKYREKYMGGLPEQLHTNLLILEGLRQQLDQYNSNLRDAENRKLGILKEI